MKILTGLITAFFGTVLSYGQLMELPLQCEGTIPTFISKGRAYQTYPEAQTFYFFDAARTENRRQILLDHIYASGRVFFGTEPSKTLQQVFSRLKENLGNNLASEQVYLVSSPTAATFHGNQQLFITTALYAQCENEDQLSYFLLRAECIQKFNLFDAYAYTDVFSVESAIQALNKRSIEQDFTADSRTAALYKSAGMDEMELGKCLSIMTYFNLPFEEQKVPSTYFNSDLMYAPYDFFSSAPLNQAREINSGSSYNERIEAYKKLQGQLGISSSTGSKKGSTSYLKSLDEVRYQLAYDQIVGGRPVEALYTLFLQDMANQENETSIWLKSHAWLDLAASTFRYNDKTYQNTIYQEINTDSQRFFRGIKKMNAFGISAMGLRLITDWKKSVQTDWLLQDLEHSKTNLIDVLAHNGNFPLDKYAKTTIQEALKKQADEDGAQNRFEKAENSNFSIDTNSFYLYAISDYMNQAEFTTKLSNLTSRPSVKPASIRYAAVYKLDKKGEINRGESLRTSTDLYTEVESMTRLNQKEDFNPVKISDYHQTRLKNDLWEQNYSQIGDIAWNTLTSRHLISGGTETKADVLFSSYYSLSPRSYHSFGLLIVTLPIILPDLILGGNHTEVHYMMWSEKDGKVLKTEVQNYKDPANKLFLGNKIYELLNTLN